LLVVISDHCNLDADIIGRDKVAIVDVTSDNPRSAAAQLLTDRDISCRPRIGLPSNPNHATLVSAAIRAPVLAFWQPEPEAFLTQPNPEFCRKNPV